MDRHVGTVGGGFMELGDGWGERWMGRVGREGMQGRIGGEEFMDELRECGCKKECWGWPLAWV